MTLKDDNNNPSEPQTGSPLDSRGEADGSSNHSADSIDFFTARERFLGLAQDGGEQKTLLSPEGEEVDEEEEQETSPVKSSLQSDTCDRTSPDRTRPTHNDNGVSVRHIVTEIEAISHSASSSSSSSLPSASPSPQTVQSDHQEEAEDSKAQLGSVRRAAEQLEQKLRQEQDVTAPQRSPLHSPSTEQPPVGLTQCSRSPDPPHTAEHSITQGENMAVSAKPKDGDRHTGSHVQDPSFFQNSHHSQFTGAMPDLDCTSVNSEAVTSSLVSANQLEESSLDTSVRSHSQGQQVHQNLADSCQMAVDGVTVQESDTDEGPDSHLQVRRQVCGPDDCEAQSRLVHSSQELERIQHTLRELQAFLQEGVGLEDTDSRAQELEQPQGLRDTMDTEPGHCKGLSSEHMPPGPAHRQQLRDQRGPSEPTGWHRTFELEARLRQAGLTPPSLMKRSASLAKLDCLELSANDLSDLDLRPQTRSVASSHSHSPSSSYLTQSHSDDTWKKQKVLSLNSYSDKTDLSVNGTSSSSSSSTQEDRSEGCGSSDADDLSSSAGSASRQQGRGHSSRRSRKASAERKQRSLLYNTM